MKTALTRVLALALLSGIGLLLAACNTTKGFGNDIDALGESISGSAEKHGARP